MSGVKCSYGDEFIEPRPSAGINNRSREILRSPRCRFPREIAHHSSRCTRRPALARYQLGEPHRVMRDIRPDVHRHAPEPTMADSISVLAIPSLHEDGVEGRDRWRLASKAGPTELSAIEDPRGKPGSS